jgi:hypothetical protein
MVERGDFPHLALSSIPEWLTRLLITMSQKGMNMASVLMPALAPCRLTGGGRLSGISAG